MSTAAASRRLAHFVSALSVDNAEVALAPEYTAASSAKSDNDVVIVSALRTPIGKAKRGVFKDTHPTDLLAAVLEATIKRTKIDPKLIQDICVGTVLAPGGGATQARMAQFLAGIPETASLSTVNRQCSSGLQAFVNIATAIQSGVIDIGIGAGFESMSLFDMASSVGDVNPRIFDVENARACLTSMGETSENVAEQFGVTRKEQDDMAFRSYERAVRAVKEGRFANEIVPITTVVKDANGGEKTITVSQDEGPRPTSLETLNKLRPAFKQGGTTTAGNSSQVSDGAAAVLAMRRSVAKKLGLPILGRFVSYAVAGVPPSIMGIGPALAIPEALKKAGLSVGDIEVFEINEAFASQATYCQKKLGIPEDKLNPNGGAIALGHPLGCTGARQIATLLNELKPNGYGVVSMCIGTGMGAAAVFQRE